MQIIFFGFLFFTSLGSRLSLFPAAKFPEAKSWPLVGAISVGDYLEEGEWVTFEEDGRTMHKPGEDLTFELIWWCVGLGQSQRK